MPIFGQDLIRKKLTALIGRDGGKAERHFQEVKQKFDEISAVMKLYAEQSGGTFALSVDERYRDPDWTRLPFPVSYFLPTSDEIYQAHPEIQGIIEDYWRQASINWQFKNPEIRFVLHKIFILAAASAENSPTPSSRLPKVPSLLAECSVKPRRVASLTIQRKGLAPFTGPTGLRGVPGASWIRPLYDGIIPKKLQVLEAKQPTTTYYCPFGESGLQEMFTLRSTSVQLGQIFAKDATLAQLLLELPNLANLSVGFVAGDLGNDFGLFLSANPNPSVKQFELMHQLMTRSLDLLEKSGVIGEDNA